VINKDLKGINNFLFELNKANNHLHLYPQVEATFPQCLTEVGVRKTTRNTKEKGFCHCKWHYGNQRTQQGTKALFYMVKKKIRNELEETQWQVIINKGAALDTVKDWMMKLHLNYNIFLYLFAMPLLFCLFTTALSSCEALTDEDTVSLSFTCITKALGTGKN